VCGVGDVEASQYLFSDKVGVVEFFVEDWQGGLDGFEKGGWFC
jgi:hypothetical protein